MQLPGYTNALEYLKVRTEDNEESTSRLMTRQRWGLYRKFVYMGESFYNFEKVTSQGKQNYFICLNYLMGQIERIKRSL